VSKTITLASGDVGFRGSKHYVRASRCSTHRRRWNYFESWLDLVKYVEAVTQESSLVSQFESAVDAIVDVTWALSNGCARESGLIRARSTRRHHATRCTSWVQTAPRNRRLQANAVEVAKILLDAGAEGERRREMYAERRLWA